MRNKWTIPVLLLVIGIIVMVAIGVFSAIAASNTVPNTRADVDSKSITANQLKPSECAELNLTNIVSIGAGETGTAANDLILGTDKADAEIRGGAGDDCILGGKGNERQKIDKEWVPGLYGEDGDDVLIGGPGNKDICEGGPGNDTFYSCETEL